MDAKQLKLGKNKTVFEETCFICSKELKDPDFYEAADTSSYALCSKHDNWKFKALIEFQLPLLLFGIPVIVVSSLLGVEPRLGKTVRWIGSKLEEADT
jgi:hypothetical protein